MKMKKPATRKVAKKTMAAKKPVRKMKVGGAAGDPVKPKKPPVKKPTTGVFDEMGTRAYATLIKTGEEFFPSAKEFRTKEEQAILNKDARIHQYNKQQAQKKSASQAQYRKEVQDMQKKGYNKAGFRKGGKVTARKKK